MCFQHLCQALPLAAKGERRAEGRIHENPVHVQLIPAPTRGAFVPSMLRDWGWLWRIAEHGDVLSMCPQMCTHQVTYIGLVPRCVKCHDAWRPGRCKAIICTAAHKPALTVWLPCFIIAERLFTVTTLAAKGAPACSQQRQLFETAMHAWEVTMTRGWPSLWSHVQCLNRATYCRSAWYGIVGLTAICQSKRGH